MDTSAGIYISGRALNVLSPSLRVQLLGELFGKLDANGFSETFDDVSNIPASEEEIEHNSHFAELSPGKAREFYIGCGPKTKTAVEIMAKSPTRQFQCADIAEALGVKPYELSGVWGGLTKRIKTVTKDQEAYLIFWSGPPVNDSEGNYMDQQGELTEMTYTSFRKALNMK